MVSHTRTVRHTKTNSKACPRLPRKRVTSDLQSEQWCPLQLERERPGVLPACGTVDPASQQHLPNRLRRDQVPSERPWSDRFAGQVEVPQLTLTKLQSAAEGGGAFRDLETADADVASRFAWPC